MVKFLRFLGLDIVAGRRLAATDVNKPVVVISETMARRHLFGLSPLDPVAHGGVVLLRAIAACAATYCPARRATRVDPGCGVAV